MTDTAAPARPQVENTVFLVIFATSLCHMLNDVMQSLLAALYPMIKEDYQLAFWQIGLLTFTFQVTASLLQPAIGLYTDKRPMPNSLPFGMAASLCGLLLLAFSHSYYGLLGGAAMIGIGSAIFHPEASRVARMASGGRFGLAQSWFQVGGNFGSAIGPLLAAFIIVPRGQTSVAWFALVAFAGMAILSRVAAWQRRYSLAAKKRSGAAAGPALPRKTIVTALAVLAMLTFAKNIYMVSFSSYYTFYAIHRFGVSVQTSQILLFVFLGATALGTLLGGPIGDRIGARNVIWLSILGVLPFSLMLPYADLTWTPILTFIIGLVLSSAFPAIVVFAQELVPGRVGMIAGLFFGFAFGMAGIAAAALGIVADWKGIDFVYAICSYLPFLGLLVVFLPRVKHG